MLASGLYLRSSLNPVPRRLVIELLDNRRSPEQIVAPLGLMHLGCPLIRNSRLVAKRLASCATVKFEQLHTRSHATVLADLLL